MLMIALMIGVWAIDVFLLRPRWMDLLKKKKDLLSKAGFLTSFVLFVVLLLFPDRTFFNFFCLIFFVCLGFSIVDRLKDESASYSYARDQDCSVMNEAVFFIFMGTLLKWFWGFLILSAVLEVVRKAFPLFLSEELVAASSLSLFAGALMLILAVRFRKQVPLDTLKDLFGLSQGMKPRWMMWFGPFVSGLLFSMMASFLLINYFNRAVTPFSEVLDQTEPSGAVIFFLGAAVLIAPFLEEIVFRGFFFKVIGECRGRWRAFWLVGASFGFLHMDQYWGDWAGIAFIFLLGFLLTGFRMASGSVRPAMILHYTFNFFMVIFPAVFFVISRPIFAEYYMHRDEFSVAQRKYLLEESLLEDDQNAMAYHEAALLYLENDLSLPQALMYSEQALNLMPERTIFQLTHADILYAMGREGEYRDLLNTVKKKSPVSRSVTHRLNKLQH